LGNWKKRCSPSNYTITQLPNYSILLMRSQPKSRRKASRSGEDGYVLLTLLLVVALMIMATAVILPSITFEIKRDREEEMIHRGVQYARAVRAYYRKFGRYPTKIEDLENTNNLRFLRKRYKDPITGKDFRLLHYGEVKLTFGTGIGGIAPGVGGVPGANAAGLLGALNGAGGFGQASALGGNGAFGQSSAFGGNSGFGQNTLGGSSGFGTNSNSSFGQNQPENNSPQGTDASQSSSQQPPGSNQPGTQTVPGSDSPGDRFTADQPAQTFGGGPIVGVVSLSKKDTIREFNHKKKYNEWQFIYDPGTDRGGLLMTPNQPPIQGFGAQGGQNPNAPNNGLGSTGSFGTPPQGLQNNPSSFGPGTGTNPPNNPPQQ
jgi:type II secretory pathway pseudopilin PulG